MRSFTRCYIHNYQENANDGRHQCPPPHPDKKKCRRLIQDEFLSSFFVNQRSGWLFAQQGVCDPNKNARNDHRAAASSFAANEVPKIKIATRIPQPRHTIISTSPCR
jgi:hypothetical protein